MKNNWITCYIVNSDAKIDDLQEYPMFMVAQ